MSARDTELLSRVDQGIQAADAEARLPSDDSRLALERLLVAAKADQGLQCLVENGALSELLPEVAATVGFAQEGERHHKNVWEHIKQVVVQAEPRVAVRWGALLHDVGKVSTRAETDDGRVTFLGHPEVGAEMFDQIAARLAFPVPLAERVRFLIAQHQRPAGYHSDWTDSAVRRFDRQAGAHYDDLMALSRADVTSAFADKRERIAKRLAELDQRVEKLRAEDAQRSPLPSGIGKAIVDALKLSPGPQVGRIKDELLAAIARGDLQAERDAAYYIAAIATHCSSALVSDDE